MSLNMIYSHDLAIPYSAINISGKIKPDWLLNQFQDAASYQCHQLGISGFDMAPKQLKWVVAQYQIQIHGKLDWLTPITLKTWRAPWKNLYEVRKFSITPINGSPIVTATGVWILIKASNSKPVRLSPNIPEHLMESTSQPVDIIKDRQVIETPDHESEFQVRVHDLDLNQHVNNVVYLRWAVESLPVPHSFTYTPVDCQISYLKECFYPDSILSRIKMDFSESGLLTRHSIIGKNNKNLLANLSIAWEKTYPADPYGSHES